MRVYVFIIVIFQGMNVETYKNIQTIKTLRGYPCVYHNQICDITKTQILSIRKYQTYIY